MVTFKRRMNVPRRLSPEFLLVDLVNELGDLAEDRGAVLSRVREKAKEINPKSSHGRSLSTANIPHRKSFRRCCSMTAETLLDNPSKRIACGAPAFEDFALGYRVQQARRCHAVPSHVSVSRASFSKGHFCGTLGLSAERTAASYC